MQPPLCWGEGLHPPAPISPRGDPIPPRSAQEKGDSGVSVDVWEGRHCTHLHSPHEGLPYQHRVHPQQ